MIFKRQLPSVKPDELKFFHQYKDTNDTYDYSGNGNNGIKVNSPTVGGFKSYFDRVSKSFIEVAHSDTLDIADEITMSCWYRITDEVPFTRENRGLMCKWNAASNNDGCYEIIQSKELGALIGVVYGLVILEGNTFVSLYESSMTTTKDQEWHFICARWTDTVRDVFIDEQKYVRTPPISGTIKSYPSIPLRIGTVGDEREDPGTGVYFGGEIAFPMIFNRVITDNEVTALFESQKGYF